jgi:uridine kinase
MESKLVLIGGGSSSGKTYIAKNAIKALNMDNDVVLISFDDYYNDLSYMSEEERHIQNMDEPSAFDWKLLNKHMKMLKENKPIEKPVYNFNTFSREDYTVTIKPHKLIILEGIMALENEKIRNMADLKVFVSASPERRFLRRLIRDHTERDNRPYERIIKQYFDTVKPMYDLYVKPTQYFADAILYNEGTEESESKAVNLLTTLLRALTL